MTKSDKYRVAEDLPDRPRLRSLLTPGLRAWLGVAMVFVVLIVANSLYLVINRLAAGMAGEGGFFSVGRDSIPKLFQVMLLSHTGIGSITVLLLLGFALAHLPRVWRRHRPVTVATGVSFVAAGLVLAVTGPFLVYASASREHGWVWWSHVVAGALATLLYIGHRSVSYVPATSRGHRRFWTAAAGLTALAFVAHGLEHWRSGAAGDTVVAQADRGPGGGGRDLKEFVSGKFVPVGFVPPASPFFPSAATTTTGGYLPERIITRGDFPQQAQLEQDLDEIGFAVNAVIGAETCERCHADIVAQWKTSAHRFASMNNPFYEATINDMRKNATSDNDWVRTHVESFPQWKGRTGEIKSKWCSGCHDPALMLAGKMVDPIERRSPQAQAGLTCLACHAIDQIHNRTGNGNYNIADHQEDPYLFAKAETGTVAALLHDTAIKARPEVHKRQMLKPFFRSSEFCGTCHKVSLQEPVNGYRWLRGQNEYDNWHDSGVALNASRTFYLPPNKRVCQDCHMPPENAVLGDVSAKNGKVRSHRFLAVNTALPFVRHDQETIKHIEAFLRDEKMSIDVFAVVREDEEPRQRACAVNLDAPPLRPGERVVFDVVVRNKGVGHTFPGGTNDSNEGWIELTVLDESDTVVAQSGFVGPDRYVDKSAHYFRALIVDRNSQPIRRRNAQDIFAPVYANLIGPGTAHTVHYALTVPQTAGGKLKVRARLMWRKFDREYTEFAFSNNRAGFAGFEECPDLPITEIASSEVTFAVAGHGGVTASAAGEKADQDHDQDLLAGHWMRYNDYGIGLLLQGDTKGAEFAFGEVARLRQDLIDGPRNLARVALADGNLEVARTHLLRCEELQSNDPRTAFFWGNLLLEEGRYIEAASAFRRVLQQFPEDRATWQQLGRVYYLDGKFEQAVEAYEQVLTFDPEDRIAHYHIMLSQRALGNEAEAAAAEEAYRIYKIDETQQAVTQEYRLRHPEDNHESQAIHVHELDVRSGEVVQR